MTAAQTAAKTDKSNERFVVITGTVPSREIEVATRAEAVELAHRTNGSWTRIPSPTTPKRTILVHLNIELRDGDERTPEQIADEIVDAVADRMMSDPQTRIHDFCAPLYEEV